MVTAPAIFKHFELGGQIVVPSTRPLFELYDDALDVLAPRAFESTEIEARLLWFNARQIHQRRAFWALRPGGNWRVFVRILENLICDPSCS